MENEQLYKVLSMKSIAQQINDLTYSDYFYRLMLLARTVFKWNNLPDGLDEKWIEEYLFTEGRCIFYKDTENGIGYMVAKCGLTGNLNHYNEPTRLQPIANNGYTHTELENNEDCILIRNNDEMIPTRPTIQMYAYRLADISRTIDININAMKTPILIKCSEKQKMSLKRVYQNWNGNEPVTFADKTLELDKFEVLKTDAPIVFDKLQIQKHAIWNEAMTFMGINNANMDKRERLVDDEVQANNEQVELSVHVMLKARQKACELINKKFGTNISVEIRKREIEDIEELDDIQNPLKDSKPFEVVRGGAK